MSQTRRLAAILAADVAGYSRLMGADEDGTHEGLKAHLQALVEPKIAEHRGRTVKNTGDGFLAEFPSVIDAVRCAAEVQRGMAESEPEVPEVQRIRFRIGINVGDVIVEEHDIFGDGVNVAARLEALAEPGGICVSRVVRDQVRDRLDFAFEDLGERQVKNIARPVRVYAARPEPPRVLTAAGAVATPQTAAAPRLSIVVLPFTNLSDDQEQQYFADGIAEDLTTDLGRIAGMFVISRNTAFTYRKKPVVTKQIGRELGVRYVLQGSVRRSGNQVRVNAQLIDAETDAQLWAERFDGDTSDLLALQDEVTSQIANALGIELIAAEAARSTQHPDALDYILRGRATALEAYSERVSCFEHALALDPSSVDAQSWLARALIIRVIDGMSDTPVGDIARAEGLVGQALAASPRSALAHFAKGQVLRAQDRYDEAIREFETVLVFNRNWVDAIASLGWCRFFTGSIEEAISLLEQAIHASPRDPSIGYWYFRIGVAHLVQSRLDDAIEWFEKARSANPGNPRRYVALASAYALKGQTEHAAGELAEARRMADDDRYSSIAHLKAGEYFGTPKVQALFEATFFAGLRKAGMPEE
jgi:TolB-like protein/class 3 adenylate cyclase/Tfp pilus assembly protein PilF